VHEEEEEEGEEEAAVAVAVVVVVVEAVHERVPVQCQSARKRRALGNG